MLIGINLNNFLKNKNENLKKINFFKFLIFILCLFVSLFINFLYFKPDNSIFIGAGIDKSNNVYRLNVNDKKNQYKITKINNKGVIVSEKELENYKGVNPYYYRQIEVDTEGNLYLLRELRNTNDLIFENEIPITEESVVMYDNSGNFIKILATLDYSEIPGRHTKGCIKKIQITENRLRVLSALKNVLSLSSVNTIEHDTLTKEFSFEISPPNIFDENPEDWILDAAFLKSGKVFYSTKSGDLMFVDKDGSSVNCKSLINSKEVLINNISVDSFDNIYFTDNLTGSFYSLNSNTMNLSMVFNLWDNTKFKDIKIRDLRKLKAVDKDTFFAVSKRFNDPFYLRISSTENDDILIKNIKHSYFSWNFFNVLFVTIVFYFFLLLLFWLSKRGINRISFLNKVIAIFVPILILSGILITFIFWNYENKNIRDTVSNFQSLGAINAADRINGDDLEFVFNKLDFSSTEYSHIYSEVKHVYEDIKNKFEDKNDFIVVYAVKGNKIYSFMSTKYLSSSGQFKTLQYVDPDMIDSSYALSDCLLESDEITTLNSAKEELVNGFKISHKSFYDIYGKLEAFFAPIKNSSGDVVGFLGSFLNEDIHIKDQMNNLILKCILLLSIIFISIFASLYFILFYSFKSVRKLRKGVEHMIKGNWEDKIEINSKDEIKEISMAVNDMSDKIYENTNNLITINECYLRFIPKELLNLLGKERITEVNLSDNKETNLSILYITFNIDSDEFGKREGRHSALFDILSKCFVNLFKIIQKNKGVVQSFSGLSVLILFPDGAFSAFKAAVEIYEMQVDDRIKQNMRMVLGFGVCLMGIIGSKTRLGTTIISDEMLRLMDVSAHIGHLEVKFSATQNFMTNIKDEKINSRYLGKCTGVKCDDYDLFEILDSYESSKKEVYKKTKENFDMAIKYYYDSDFQNARKMFSDVVKINENDLVAIFYLEKCDAFINSVQTKSTYASEKSNKNLF